MGLGAVQLRAGLPAPTRRRGSRRMSPSAWRIRFRPTRIARSSTQRGFTTVWVACLAIRVPTMIVHGRHDRLIPVANAELIAESDAARSARDPGALGTPVPDRAAGRRRDDRRRSSQRAFGQMRRGDDLRVADVIRERAAERGDAIAIVQGSRPLTFAALDERSNRLAQALRRAGVSDRAIASPTSTAPLPRWSSCCSPSSKIGAVIVPMNWRLAAPELSRRARGQPRARC